MIRDNIYKIDAFKKHPFYYSINTISINHCRHAQSGIKKSAKLLLKENVNKEYTCTQYYEY